MSKPFEVIEYDLDLTFPMSMKISELEINHENPSIITKDLRFETDKLNKDLKENSDIDQENAEKIDEFESSLKLHRKMNWTTFSNTGFIILLFFVIMSVFLVKIFKNTTSETIIKMVKIEIIEVKL